MNDLLDTGETSDVTLVCDDHSKIKAHKFVLKAVSPLFKDIFENEDENGRSYIYLRGTKLIDMKAMLEFLYKGEVTINQERINEFIRIAKEMEITEIQDLISDTDISRRMVDSKFPTDNENECDENRLEKMEKFEGKPNVMHIENLSKYQCSQCDSKFKFKGDRKKHIQAKHEGIRFSCHYCAYQATTKQDLKKHIDIHEGVKYPCTYCEYKANRKSNLKLHIKKRHQDDQKSMWDSISTEQIHKIV